MLLKHAPTLVCATALLGTSLAQSTTSIPTDLTSGFDPSSITLQVSYSGDSASGFKDGTKFTPQDTSKTPTFALGDSSGINTAVSFLVLLLDTTDLSNRTLHFLQTDFKADGDKTSISSKSQPAVPYRGPGAFSETGTRQYSFLLYQQTGKGFSVKNLPATGSTFDVQKFQSDNGLKAPEAGVMMVVDLGGASAGSGTGSSAAPSSTPSQSQSTPTATSISPSSAAASSIATISTTQSAASPSNIPSSNSPVIIASPVSTSTTTVIMALPNPSSAPSSSVNTNNPSTAPSLTVSTNSPSTTSTGTAGLATVTGNDAISNLNLSLRALQITLGAVVITWFMV
ncbi:MAG: hypothetical protein M1812_005155 [Candelaria pacifica]|nr:MAG: hypothetical protein M1812_005155 [Candelaria pacifica]